MTSDEARKSHRQKAQYTGLRLSKELVTTPLCVAHCMQCVSLGSEQRTSLVLHFMCALSSIELLIVKSSVDTRRSNLPFAGVGNQLTTSSLHFFAIFPFVYTFSS